MAKKTDHKKICLPIVLVAVLLISGCAQSGQQGSAGLGNGVAILEFKSNQEGAQLRTNEPVQFVAKIQNQGTVKANNVRVDVVELLDKELWAISGNLNLGALTGFNQEQKLAGPVRTVTIGGRAPRFSVQQSVTPKLSVKYDNVLKGSGTITLVDTDTFIQKRDAGQGLITEFGVADAGPLDIKISVPEVRTSQTGDRQDLIVPVQITLTDKVGNPTVGHVYGGSGSVVSGQDYTYPVRVSMPKLPSGLSLDTTGADPLCLGGVINLNSGKTYDTTCIFKVNSPPERGAPAKKVSFDLQLDYTYEVLQSLAQPITILKSST